MKKSLLSLTTVLSLSLFAVEMPPMPPGFMNTEVAKAPVKKEQKRVQKRRAKVSFPKECDVIPPMLFMLPPPLKRDLDRCTIELYKPNSEILNSKLSKFTKSKVEILSIKGVESILGLYKIEYKVLASKESKFKLLNQNLNESRVVYTDSKAEKFFINRPLEID